MLSILIGFFFGFAIGFVAMALVSIHDTEITNYDDYHRGYVDGWHDAGGKE